MPTTMRNDGKGQMNKQPGWLAVMDNLSSIGWTVFAVVGFYTFASDPLEMVRRSVWPTIIGLVLGLLTSPIGQRWLRPILQRAFPWAFEYRAERGQA